MLFDDWLVALFNIKKIPILFAAISQMYVQVLLIIGFNCPVSISYWINCQTALASLLNSQSLYLWKQVVPLHSSCLKCLPGVFYFYLETFFIWNNKLFNCFKISNNIFIRSVMVFFYRMYMDVNACSSSHSSLIKSMSMYYFLLYLSL